MHRGGTRPSAASVLTAVIKVHLPVLNIYLKIIIDNLLTLTGQLSIIISSENLAIFTWKMMKINDLFCILSQNSHNLHKTLKILILSISDYDFSNQLLEKHLKKDRLSDY